MSHFIPQCHKLQLLLWQFAESIPSESLFCVKSWTCDSWRFPDFNGLCWCSTQCGLCLHFIYIFIYSFSHSFNRYLLSSHCVPGSVPTWSICSTTFVVECCPGLMCCKHRQEGCMGTWGTLKNPCEGDSLLREISFWGICDPSPDSTKKPSLVTPLRSTSHTTLLSSQNFCLRRDLHQFMDRLLEEPPDVSS